MSDSEEEACFFGTPLDPYDEDAFPKKRPISVEEQVAKDAQGRRRFHGAFTGGFSAGFYNTVGSLEGWAPAEFKSSRTEKSENKQRQKPEDFMDDEDIGEFGIAPQTVRATGDYSTSKKRKKQVFSDGPIPGVPVLETLLQAGNETVGYFLMKNMNQKKGKHKAGGPKVYGCVMPRDLPDDDVAIIEHPQYSLHDFYTQYLATPKSNSFGLGYFGLDKSHVNLFQPAHLTVRGRNNKKLSISGQAFGVGAFEDDDEDIYVKDDMSRYDFELTAASEKKDKAKPQKELILNAFVLSRSTLVPQNDFSPPIIPGSFTGKHNVKKSRFEPLAPEPEPITKRHSIDASLRAKYLGEDHAEKSYTPSNQQHKQSAMGQMQAKVQAQEEQSKKAEKSTVVDDGAPKNLKNDQLGTTSGLVFDRFVSATQNDDLGNILEPVERSEIVHGTKEMHAAVKLKMFGPLTRVMISWQPHSVLCKRFNVPEPHSGELNAQKNKRRTKNLIFEYQKHADPEAAHKPGLSVPATQPPETQTSNDKTDVSNPSGTPLPAVQADAPSPPDTQPEIQPTKQQEASETNRENLPQTDTGSTEKTIDMTERVDVSKNTDLFKAVFLSSSESESESESEVRKQDEDDERRRKEIMTASVVSEPLIPKIKPTKEGILSNIDFLNFGSLRSVSLKEEAKKDEAVNVSAVEDNLYGPKLPVNVASYNQINDRELVGNSDGWVERDSVNVKHKKHKKKHKKEKDKHKKKHKHKSKR